MDSRVMLSRHFVYMPTPVYISYYRLFSSFAMLLCLEMWPISLLFIGLVVGFLPCHSCVLRSL